MTELIQRNQIRKSDLLSYSLSVFITTGILLLFLFNAKELYHPCVIPVYFTGIIIGLDLIDWLRGRMDVFDPVGFLGIFGYHFFFISPLLQIYWGVGMSYVTQPDDWRTWLFGMALINLIGLLFYRFFRNYFLKKELANKVNKSVWKINSKRLLVISIPALLIMFVLQAYILLI